MTRTCCARIAGVVCLAALAAVFARSATPVFDYFFTAVNDSYKAYIDTANQTTDGQGNKLISVKLSTFNDSFRPWIKKNFPGGETADYAIDPYSIDCAAKTIGEHRIVWYDVNGLPLADYDFGGHLAPPIADSMKDHLMQKICGF